MNVVQAQIILLLAKHDMNVTEVGRELFYHRTTVLHHIAQVEKATGKNPLKFYDLADLIPEAEKVIQEYSKSVCEDDANGNIN